MNPLVLVYDSRHSQPVRAHILEFDDDFEQILRRKRKQPEPNPPNSNSESEFEEEEEEEQDMAVDNQTIKELSASGFMQSMNEKDEKDILETFRNVHVNISLLDAIKQIPKCAKFLKRLCTTRKRIGEKEVVHASENVSAMLRRKLLPKCKDPGELKNDGVIIPLADQSNAYPKGILEDVLVQIFPHTLAKSGWKRVNSANKTSGCLKLPSVDLLPTMVQRDQSWSGFTPGMMGYKTQVVASAIAFFYGLTLPHMVANQGGSWLDFVERSESFKVVVVASKNSTGVGRNRHQKMGCCGSQLGRELG
ncbi:hypothetical protein D8674_000112 [Pyrus ussuriensis x Pyrus communis]|uniref:Uncharacterized protein n=1 Tax=Pyrus ussuriensis x Pyrus communis TaxID=2448454 RepID=A0A5N5F7N5_9ROSA|nr:hypothetical protein D8674_000112 [Pyrus ussuriensis x Pyrus communis]